MYNYSCQSLWSEPLGVLSFYKYQEIFSSKLIHKFVVKVGPALSDAVSGFNDEMTSLLIPSLAGNYSLGEIEIERAEFNYQTSVFPLEMLIDLCLYLLQPATTSTWIYQAVIAPLELI